LSDYAQSIRRFFITDDNFARNRDWELLFDRLIELRAGDCPKIGFTIRSTPLCHKIPNFIEKAAQAGVRRVFIGLENVNPDNLIPAKKRQNKITDYRQMLQKWREHGAITCAGYIIAPFCAGRIIPAGAAILPAAPTSERSLRLRRSPVPSMRH
jgi:radical SAM superfamily enzyme YgiQ (UPF0313 family)